MHIGSHGPEYHELIGRYLEQGIRNYKKSGVSVTDVHVRSILDELYSFYTTSWKITYTLGFVKKVNLVKKFSHVF